MTVGITRLPIASAEYPVRVHRSAQVQNLYYPSDSIYADLRDGYN